MYCSLRVTCIEVATREGKRRSKDWHGKLLEEGETNKITDRCSEIDCVYLKSNK